MQNNRTIDIWNNFWLKKQNYLINILTLRILDYIEKGASVKNKDILEIGCGSGRLSYLAYLRGAKSISMLDSSEAALTASQKLFGKDYDTRKIHFIKSDLFDIKLEKKFDIVFSSGLIEHFEEKRMSEVIEIHKIYSKKWVAIVAPFDSTFNRWRMKQPDTIKNYGWQIPVSFDKLKTTYEKLGLEMHYMGRFYPLYGRDSRVAKVIRKFINKLAIPFLDNWFGGLIIAVGRV